MTWSLAAVIAALKSYALAIAGVVIVFMGWLLRDKDKTIAQQKNDIRKTNWDAENRTLKERANAKTQEIELEGQKAEQAEKRMEAILNARSGAGPDCKSR